MDRVSPSGFMIRSDIQQRKLRPILGGAGLRHIETRWIYGKSTQGRLMREKGQFKEIYDADAKQYRRVARLNPGETFDTSEDFTIEDLAPGICDDIRNNPYGDLFADLLPEGQAPFVPHPFYVSPNPEWPPPPPVFRPSAPPVAAPPVPPARTPFVPRATPDDYMGNRAMRQIQATREQDRQQSLRRFHMDDGRGAGPGL